MGKNRLKKFLCLFLSLAILFISGCSFVEIAIDNSESDIKKVMDETTVSQGLTVRFLDVGQADATFIHLPNGETMLIDAGTSDKSDTVIDYIRSARISEINYVIGTHPHSDHIGGLADILNLFETGKLYMPKVVHNTKSFENVLDAVESNEIELYTAKAGTVIYEDDTTKISLLGPVSDEYEDLNNYSAVVKIEYGEISFLFMGDAEKLAEEEITENVSADVLKVGHHGSDTSSSSEFIKRVNPEIAVISVGEDNKYNHPSEKVLKRLESVKAKIYRTDIDGDIIIESDGTNINVKED